MPTISSRGREVNNLGTYPQRFAGDPTGQPKAPSRERMSRRRQINDLAAASRDQSPIFRFGSAIGGTGHALDALSIAHDNRASC
jgi:hypothetical protein